MTTIAAAAAVDHPDTHKGIGVRIVPVAEQTAARSDRRCWCSSWDRAAAGDRVREHGDAAAGASL